MKISKLYVLLFTGMAVMSSNLQGAGCSAVDPINDRTYALIPVSGGQPGQECDVYADQIQAYNAGSAIDAAWDVIIPVRSYGSAQTISTAVDGCGKTNDGTVDTDLSGKTYRAHIAVAVSNNDNLPPRLLTGVLMHGDPKVAGWKFNKFYRHNAGAASGHATKACSTIDANTGELRVYCRGCFDKAKKNHD